MARDYEPEEEPRSAIIGGLYLIAFVAAVYLVVMAIQKRSKEADHEWAVAYLDAGAANPGTPIRLGGEKVGSVSAVDRPDQRVWLEVRSKIDNGILDAAHLAAGDSTKLAGSIEVVRLTANTLKVDSSFYLRFANGTWKGPCFLHSRLRTIPGVGQIDSVCAVLRLGSSLANRGSRSVVWLGEQTVARLLISLDTAVIREAFAAESVIPEAGFQLHETGAFGIGKQGLRLEIPPHRVDFLPRRTVSFRRQVKDSAGVTGFELVTTSNLDMQQLRAMLAFLADPAMKDAVPTTRFEMSAQDVAVMLAQTRRIIGEFKDVTAIDRGHGMLGRLTFSPQGQADLEAALRNLPALMDQAQDLIATTEVTVDSTGRSVRQLASRIDTTLTRLEPSVIAALEGARNVEDSLVVLSHELGSAVRAGRKGAKPVGIMVLIALAASALLNISRLSAGN